MAAKPKRPAATTKNTTATAATSAPVTKIPTPSLSNHYKDELGPAPVAIASDGPDHRPNQLYQGAAPPRQVQQSPNLNAGRSSQQSYAVGPVFSPPSGLQSPFLSQSSQYQPQQQSQQSQQQQSQHHQQQQQQISTENPYYASNPSPRSTNSTAYYPSDKPDTMAAATATIPRPYPQIYHTPASTTSPASPHTHDGRSMYHHPPPYLGQAMYYSGHQSVGSIQSPYTGHQNPPQMNSQPMMSYPPNTSQISHQQITSQPPSISQSPRRETEGNQVYSQTPQPSSALLPPRQQSGSTPNPGMPSGQPPMPPSTSNAAPGPIPATTPLVVRQDGNGVQWIAFEYSRDRVKMEYTIRCDVESVDANQLSQEFKSENCVYPRACVPKDQYKGNRLAYESECNQVGWALAELNTCLRGKRGLIQRAVDSWRNSNQDVRLRSRRVRRQAKMNTRAKMGTSTTQAPGHTPTTATGLPGPGSMAAPSARGPGTHSSGSQQLHHHHAQQDVSPTGQDTVGGYSHRPMMNRSSSATQHMTSPNELRQSHTFPSYQPYPNITTTMGAAMPPSMQGGMQYGRPGGSSTMDLHRDAGHNPSHAELFGEVPEKKRRKFVLVPDPQNNGRVRVRVTLDQVEMAELPDSYRKHNSVYPRSYFPTQMQLAAESTAGGRFIEDDVEEMDDGSPTIGRTTVPCTMIDGDGEIEVSQLSDGKRRRERNLNELGYRLAWGQSRVFSNRPIFLGKALDMYRDKQRATLISSGSVPTAIPPHLQTRPGKQNWTARMRAGSQHSSTAGATPE